MTTQHKAIYAQRYWLLSISSIYAIFKMHHNQKSVADLLCWILSSTRIILFLYLSFKRVFCALRVSPFPVVLFRLKIWLYQILFSLMHFSFKLYWYCVPFRCFPFFFDFSLFKPSHLHFSVYTGVVIVLFQVFLFQSNWKESS